MPQVRVLSPRCAGVAQLVEQLICNQQVRGSSPFTSSQLNMEEFPSGQRGQTVNLLLSASVVRIHPLPLIKDCKDVLRSLFFLHYKKSGHSVLNRNVRIYHYLKNIGRTNLQNISMPSTARIMIAVVLACLSESFAASLSRNGWIT